MDTEGTLSLDRFASYRIDVPGDLGPKQLGWAGITTVNNDGRSRLASTSIEMTVDQAGLIGILRRLYSVGLPIISVCCIECGSYYTHKTGEDYDN